ncbi:MAG: replication initiation protein [Gammaproteobacteria bacterium]|nr:replication initiation protein [Gammaproteobacteria bacterium]
MAKQKPSVPGGQISLFSARETPDPFRKAVQVLHSKPKSPLSLLQRKLGNAWLKNAIENQPDKDGWWQLSIKTMATDIGFDSNNRQYLKESAEALMSIIFDWDVIAPADKKVKWKASVLFPEVEVLSDAVRYQFSSQMRELMINPEIYALIDMNIVRKFRRAASLGIWEFCVRFEKIKRTSEVPWEKFRDMILGESAEHKTYQEYKFFKSKVLNPGIIEINSESNHTISLVESKIGKRVSMISFTVIRKINAEPVVEDARLAEIVGELVKLGVPQSEAKKIIRDNSFDTIKGALEYTKRRIADKKIAKVENPAAYFRNALANRYAVFEESSLNTNDDNKRNIPKSIDIKAAYAKHQLVEADKYFVELDPDDQAAMIEKYNTQQTSSLLQLKKKVTKVAQAGFFQWLAKETWGEPTAEELLEFVQGMLSGHEQS